MEILLKLRDDSKPVDIHFNRIAEGLPPKDKNFAKSLVFGTLRNQQYLDHIISRFSRHPLKKMKPKTLIALEIGVYQLLFLDRTPAPAAIHATVEALKSTGQPKWLLGFVNGLLRNVHRESESLPTPETAREEGEPLLNHPPMLVEKWRSRFGKEKTEHICRINNQEPPLTLRVNTHLMSRNELLDLFTQAGINAVPCPHSQVGITLPLFSGNIIELPGFDKGFFQVQDESAQLASLMLGPFEKRKRILDGCAGLGGKTTHIAQLCLPAAHITAVEPNKRRLTLLAENLNRLQLTSTTTTVSTTLEAFAAQKPEPFDAILLDAPCSGTGVIRRQPDIRLHRSGEDFKQYQQTQLQLLETCAGLLSEGGRLVYATCSIEQEENEEVIEKFLANHPEYVLADARNYLPASAHDFVDERGLFSPLPDVGNDGFFAAALDRVTGL